MLPGNARASTDRLRRKLQVARVFNKGLSFTVSAPVRHIKKLESGAVVMAKVLTPQKATSNANQGKKQRKKQAKREAKTMLKLEQAKQNVQKAEKKLAKTQAQLEAERTNLRDVEAELTKLRQPQQDTTYAEAATGDTAQVNEGDNIHEFMPSHEVISLPLVEGRMDIPESSETSSPAQETPGDASPSAVEMDETQQESTGSPGAEEHR
jgi:seryl-tRNA synthetase